MPSPFDITSAFNDATFSDVTIKSGDREIKCHKLVLCQGSDYFKALCGPDSKFSESKQALIELHDDHPDAVEVMLRYLYNTPYETIMEALKEQETETLHMGIFIVGKKYLISELEEKGLAGVRSSLNKTEATCEETKEYSGIFASYCFLSSYKNHHEDFGTMMVELGKKHLPGLFEFPEFRQMLEEDENKEVLDLAIKGVKRVHEAPVTVEVERSVRRRVECYGCGKKWMFTG